MLLPTFNYETMYTILCISDSDKHFATSIQEYKKRMPKILDIIDIKPVKHGSRTQIIQDETEKIIQKLVKEKKGERPIFLLSKAGKLHSTKQFLSLLDASDHRRPTGVFVIGGPYGLDEDAITRLYPQIKKISFGSHTMPHGLAKLVLIEQLYRIETIRGNKDYHY